MIPLFFPLCLWTHLCSKVFGFMTVPAYKHASADMISVWLICSFIVDGFALAAPAAASERDCYRKTCMEIEYDIREAVCCENQLYPGAGLSCCGGQAFNPEEATCCKVDDGHNRTAVTKGQSAKVSACCGLRAYNQLNEICCQSTIRTKPAPKAKCCGEEAIDADKQLCCGPNDNKMILLRNSSDHLCCGHNQFDNKTECCCPTKDGLKPQPISHSCCEMSDYCGTKAYNTFSKLCCQSTVVTKPAPNAQCCGKKAFNLDTQLCCGPNDNKTILLRNSSDHLCCGHNQFDNTTECCCPTKDGLKPQPLSSNCCAKESGVQQQKPALQPSCTEPDSLYESCPNPNYFHCCDKNPGRCDDALTVHNRRTHGCVSKWKHTAQFQHYRQHYCGTDVYWPHIEICCHGHRHPKKENTQCCGVKAYNITDPWKKCCAGTLHHLTLRGRDAQCCGSVLQTPGNVCCSSEDMEVLYSAKTGFGCCGHLQYNSSLWSCCAGRLSPVHQPGLYQSVMKESTLLSVNNLNETDLCNKMHIGTVESVSQHTIVFSSVLKILGGKATSLTSPHILKTRNHCSFPKLTVGKNYYFDDVNVYTDFNHNSILQSLHFIISKCFHP